MVMQTAGLEGLYLIYTYNDGSTDPDLLQLRRFVLSMASWPFARLEEARKEVVIS